MLNRIYPDKYLESSKVFFIINTLNFNSRELQPGGEIIISHFLDLMSISIKIPAISSDLYQ